MPDEDKLAWNKRLRGASATRGVCSMDDERGRAAGGAEGADCGALIWDRVSSEPGPDLGLLRVRYDWMRHPTGGHTLKRLVLESVDWVNCVALTSSGHLHGTDASGERKRPAARVPWTTSGAGPQAEPKAPAVGHCVMVEQFRFGLGACTLETPGGMVDAGETPLEAAQRELLEETGYGGGSWRSLGAVEPNPAIHGHLCHHFLATGVERVAAPDPGAGEAIAVRLATLDEIKQAMADGRLRHVLALSALSRVYNLFD